MSDLQALIDAGLLDKDFIDIGDSALAEADNEAEDEDIDVDLEEAEEAAYAYNNTPQHRPHVPAWTRHRQPQSASTLFNKRDTTETFEHKSVPERRRYGEVDVDDVVDTSDEEDEVTVDDRYRYYREVIYHWLYGGRGAGWWHYSEKDNDRLERKYKSGKDRTKIEINGHTLIVDFNEMAQKSGSSSRNILRIETLKDIYLKGVNGDHITKDTILKNPNEPPPPAPVVSEASESESEFELSEMSHVETSEAFEAPVVPAHTTYDEVADVFEALEPVVSVVPAPAVPVYDDVDDVFEAPIVTTV